MTIQGFDVSHYQPALTPEFVAHLMSVEGYQFGGIKCSEGSYLTDPNFAVNRAACAANRLPRFVYHEATNETPTSQLRRIMQATGGQLKPRERLALVLGDFKVSVSVATSLGTLVHTVGPIKRIKGKAWRPAPVYYANRSNFSSVYNTTTFTPKWVAAFPGDGTECSLPGAVCHQWTDHDPATHGDGDVWCGTDPAAMLAFFQS